MESPETQEDVRRALAGLPPRDPNATWTKKKPARTKAKPQYRTTTPARSKKPQASERSSMLAQRWYDLGEAEGFSFPYDVNYFALALQGRIERDKVIQKFLARGAHDQVERWVRKMIEIWWNPVDSDGNGGYLTGEVNQRNAKDYFLDTDWDDLREYARTSLRAAYLKEHGKRIASPVYPGQQDYQDRLRDLHSRQVVDQHVKRLAEPEIEPQTREELDEGGRQRLRSFADKRRKK